MGIVEQLKKDNLKYELEEGKDFVILKLKVIKPVASTPEEYLTVYINADRITAELNEDSYFALEKYDYNKIDSEIGN